MDGCLNCKACATQCPIKVDVPSFKAEFLDAYHQRYARPIKDYFVASLEWVLMFIGLMPRLMNWFFRAGWFRWLLAKAVGIVDSPLLSEYTLRRGLRQRRAPELDLDALAGLPDTTKANSVILLQDAFTTFYESNVALACYDLLSELGYDVYVAPFRPNGKALHVKGFMNRFGRLVEDNAEYLRRLARAGIALVGIDPAVTLTYRDEYLHALGRRDPGFRVELLQEWLEQRTERISDLRRERAETPSRVEFALLGHCTEKTLAPQSQRQWQQVFQAFGLKLELLSVGCCGMCGVYGHEAAHYAESRGLYAMSWQRHESARGRTLAQGHSCRSQVKRFGGFVPEHPAEALVSVLRGTNVRARPAPPV
jgi:Fe-S oxidoreductase